MLHLYVIFSTWQRRVCAFVLRLLLLTLNETNVSSFIVRCVLAAAPMWPRSGSSSQKLTTKLNYRGNNCSPTKIARLRVLTWFHWAELHEMEWFYQPFLDSCLFLPLTHTSVSSLLPLPLSLSFFCKKPQRNVLRDRNTIGCIYVRAHVCVLVYRAN